MTLHRRIGWLTGLLLIFAAARARGAQVEIVLAPRPPIPSIPSPAEITLRSDLPGREPLHGVIATPGEPRTFEIDEGPWSVEVKVPDLWAPRLKLVVNANDHRRLQVALYEATVLQGRVEVERGEAAPGEVAIDLYQPVEEPTPKVPRPVKAPPAERLAFRCPVQEGRFECPAPVGIWDVRLGATDRIANYLWKVPFPKDAPAVVGPIRLQRGASVVGWVRPEGMVKKGSVAFVRLTPQQAASSASAETTDRALALSGQADNRGFFQLTGVPPGAYVLTASLEGFAPARFFPLRVFENRESQLEEPLALRPPVTLEVRVSPPLDLQQRPWNIEVFDLGNSPGAMESAAKGTAGVEGHWRSPALSSGHFLLQLSDLDRTVWQIQEVELSDALAQVDFDLDFIEVDGDLRLNGEPVAATLYFGGRMGVPSLRFDSDPEGRFEGHLPREGTWRVEIQAQNPLIRRSLPRVEVRRPPGKTVARVSIDLPGGELRGRTIDDQGKPVEGAMVLLGVAGEPPIFVQTNEAGEFEAHGLGTGDVLVEARTRDLQADALWVPLARESTVPVELVLRKTREIRGWVLGPFGGVPGAQVIATTLAGNQGQAVTDLAGRFSLRAPAGATTFDVMVLPPGYSFQARRVSLFGEEELRLFVEPEGGTLILEGLDDPEALASSAVLLFHEGVPIYVSSTLQRWSEGNGQRWVGSGPRLVPQMQPGVYQVCLVPPARMSTFRQGPQAAGRCAEGMVVPGGELTLRVPREPVTK